MFVINHIIKLSTAFGKVVEECAKQDPNAVRVKEGIVVVVMYVEHLC